MEEYQRCGNGLCRLHCESNFCLFFPDNKALFVISMSDNGAQIYELVAQTVSEKTVYVLDIANI